MTASTTNEKIILNFCWKGPTSWHGGWSHRGLDIRVIDLVFKNAKTNISVSIPENISPLQFKNSHSHAEEIMLKKPIQIP